MSWLYSPLAAGAAQQAGTAADLTPSVFDSVTTNSSTLAAAAVSDPQISVTQTVTTDSANSTVLAYADPRTVSVFDAAAVNTANSTTLLEFLVVSTFTGITVSSTNSTVRRIKHVRDVRLRIPRHVDERERVKVQGVVTLDLEVKINVSDATALTESTGQHIGLEINELESCSIQEYTELLTEIKLSVYDSTSISEDIVGAVSAPGTTTVEISVFDAAACTEQVTSIVSGLALSVFETVAYAEYIVSTVSTPVVSIFDTCSVLESVTLVVAGLTVSVNDSVSAQQDVTASVGTLVGSVYDSTLITEFITNAVSALPLVVFETATLAEYVSLTVSTLGVVAVETVTAAQYCAATVSSLLPSAVDWISLSESAISTVSTPYTSVFDNIVVSEQALVAVQQLLASGEISVQDTTTVSESCEILIPTYLLSVIDNITIVDVVLSEVWPTTVIATEYISISEHTPVFVEVTNLFNVQDSVSVGESTGAQVSDLPGSVFDTVTLTEQAAAEIRLQVSASELVGVTEQVVLAPPAINAAVADYVSVEDQVIFTQDLIVSIYDPAQVQDTANGALESGIGVYDSILVDAVTFARPEISLGPSAFETVTVVEAVTMFSGHISLSITETVTVTEQVIIYWIVADGLLVIDCDVIVPLIESELMCPELMCGVDSPEIEVQIMMPSANVYMQLPTLDLEVA